MFLKFLSAVSLATGSLAAQPILGELPTELRPRANLIGILKALDGTIADPRSITDVVLCPATRVKFDRAGRPTAWQVHFSMNAKSAAGGYAGRTMYMAIFRVGKRTEILRTQMDDDEGFNRLINDSSRKRMRDCPSVSNEQLAELVGVSDRPVVDVSQ